MNINEYDVLGIGNAIVDILSKTNDAFLIEHKLTKGTMKIIDLDASELLYKKIIDPIEISGGSAANTIAALSALQNKCAFIGKVRDDSFGKIFRKDIDDLGVDFITPPSPTGDPTAKCFVLVTPDAERTMQTFLGASVNLEPEDIDSEMISKAKIIYLEGYLWDSPKAKEAFVKASRAARANGRQVSLSLSDPFCVDRHREDFLEFIKNYVDILFANEEEILSLFSVSSFEMAIKNIRECCEIAALTRNKNGSVVVSGKQIHNVKAELVENVVDTTGAGDSYAAGFLHGLTHKKPLNVCAQIGGILAADIISDYGARSKTTITQLIQT